MDFEFTADQLELRDNARAVLAKVCPPSVVRSVFEGSGRPDEVWAALVELDWPAIGVNLGLTFIEVGVVVEELGRVVAPTPFLATVTQFVPTVREAGGASGFLDRVADGSCTGALVLAEGSEGLTARRSDGGWVLDGERLHVMDGATANELAVVARADEGLGVFVVPGERVTAKPVSVIDPTMPVATVRFDGVEVSGERVVLPPGAPEAATAIDRAVEEATTALALSTVATCRAIFETTLQYAKDREQFGRPIGSFQAVKHRLADMYLAIERAASLSYFAALTIAEDDDRRPVAASMAKAAAGDCQRLVAADGLQLHGGIGFTWENDIHFLLKRAKAGDLLFGTAAAHRARLARLLGVLPA